jgi:hypothetical protein
MEDQGHFRVSTLKRRDLFEGPSGRFIGEGSTNHTAHAYHNLSISVYIQIMSI